MSWESSPPRKETSNLARRRQQRQQRSLTLEATASDPSPKESKRSPKPYQRRPNRPGCNSYLKVELDNGTISKLYRMAVQVQNRIQQKQKSMACNDDSATTEVPLLNTLEKKKTYWEKGKLQNPCDSNHARKPPRTCHLSLAAKLCANFQRTSYRSGIRDSQNDYAHLDFVSKAAICLSVLVHQTATFRSM